jgi:IclR family mhp operon transcriptional activator
LERADSDAAYKQVQGLSRGLAVLRALSNSDYGRAHLGALASATGLHRTTVRRLLETLTMEGLVERSADDGAFQLTLAFKRMGDGFSIYDQVAERASPILRNLSAEIVWPCSLATPEEDVMIIRAATHDMSPLSFHRRVVGRRLPMLSTSMGRAFLAFSPAATRERILELIASKYEAGEVPTMSLATFRQILIRTTLDGYGANHGEWSEDKKVAAIAIPVRGQNEQVVACVNVVAVTRALNPRQLATKFLKPLRAAAAAIEKVL